MIFNMTGGGAGLNFKVVAYETADLLLADTPKENTSGVITTTPITGWYFAAEQPENMVEGEVWFPTGISSTVAFNALKNNGVQVYPQSAKQYVNGALKNVEAWIYKKGKWTAFETILMENGKVTNEFGDFGNPQKYIPFPTSGHNRCSFQLDTSDEKATLSWKRTSSSNAYSASVAYFENKAYLTNINTIKIKAGETSTGAEDDFSFTASTTIGDNYSKAVSQTIQANEEVNIDVSSLSGSYYLGITCYTGKSNAFVEIIDWRMA